jgi:hypothetical protein
MLLSAAALSGCAATSESSAPPNNPPHPGVLISLTPTAVNIRAADTFTFQVTISGAQNKTVEWLVNDTRGGSSSFGTIDPNGKYTAPVSLPAANRVTVKAVSAQDPTVSASSAVTLLNPTPALTGINPSSVNLGAFTLILTGHSFVSGAQVSLNGSPLTTTVNSPVQVTATGIATSAGVFSVVVRNPDPGSSASSSLNLQVNGSNQSSSCNGISPGPGASLNGFVPFPSDSLWNRDVSTAPVDTNSAAIISFIGPTIGLHADFGSSQFQGSTIGIPYQVVDGSQSLVNINFTAYGDESDPGPMPIPLNALIEGYPNPGTGDRHVLVLDTVNCFLYELDNSYPQATAWNADSAAVWDLQANEQRPYTWTSADAAGLPILPGLVRYDEAASGAIHHALRFTLPHSRAAFTPPASHWAANSSNVSAAPMGMRVRLKANFDISGFSAANRVILTAMKTYGLIMADNGSSMFISGAPDERWDNDDLHALASVTASNFEVIQMSPIYTSANLPAGPPPKIMAFSASSTSVASGTSVTLSWQVSGASYVIVSPQVGVSRNSSENVTPAATTTYTLYATNAFGRTAATVTVTVH